MYFEGQLYLLCRITWSFALKKSMISVPNCTFSKVTKRSLVKVPKRALGKWVLIDRVEVLIRYPKYHPPITVNGAMLLVTNHGAATYRLLKVDG